MCQRWQLEKLTEAAQSLAAAVVTEAALDQPSATDLIELRLELRTSGLLAFHSGAFSRAVPHAGQQAARVRGWRWSDGSPIAGGCVGRPTAVGSSGTSPVIAG